MASTVNTPRFSWASTTPLKGGAEGRKGSGASGKDAEASGKGTTDNSNQENSVEQNEQKASDDAYRALREAEEKMAAERQAAATGRPGPGEIQQTLIEEQERLLRRAVKPPDRKDRKA